MRVRWTTPAREQLVQAHRYIADDNPAAAARTADKIWKSAQLLGRHPMAGKVGRAEGTRELVVRDTPFLVAYRVRKNEVWILAVLHAARKWPDEF